MKILNILDITLDILIFILSTIFIFRIIFLSVYNQDIFYVTLGCVSFSCLVLYFHLKIFRSKANNKDK